MTFPCLAPSSLPARVRWRVSCGFSLVELLVVIAVIAILAGIIVPVALKAVSRFRNIHCLNNMRQIGVASVLYSLDHEGDLPVAYRQMVDAGVTRWDDSLIKGGYLEESGESKSIFKCPAELALRGVYNTRSTYSLNANIGRIDQQGSPSFLNKYGDSDEPSKTVLLADGFFNAGSGRWNAVVWPSDIRTDFAHTRGINHLFFDGHVEALRPEAIPTTITNPEGRLFWLGKY